MRTVLALAAFLLASCTPRAVIPDSERARVDAALDGQQRWLRVACYATPLYGERSKVLASDQPLDELDLVETPGGAPVPPPAAERVIPPGTAVRVLNVEFPTPWVIAQRVVTSPRYHPWVLLTVPGDARPYVIVLSQTAASFDDVRGEVDRVLSNDSAPAAAFAALPPEQREAVLRKEPVEGMPTRAVEMAWGLPEKKRIDRPAGTEEWTWPGGKRRASFQDDRLVKFSR